MWLYTWSSQAREWRDRGLLWLIDHWIIVACLFLGLYVWLPFLAPVLMELGLTETAGSIYGFFSTQCHLMAQRTFFLFGAQLTYTVDQLPVSLTGQYAGDMLALRSFIGNDEFGWKVAQCSRSVYLFGAVWVGAIAFGVLRQRRRIRLMPLALCVALMLPMVIDGTTHLVSEIIGGVVGGFRYENAWLVRLTGNAFPEAFYRGDVWGSFNSWARLISAALFGLASVWLTFPSLDRPLRRSAWRLRNKWQPDAVTPASGDVRSSL